MFRLNERQWNQIKKDLKFISKGAQGEVFKGKLLNQEVAVKKFKHEDDFVKEVECINNCACEFIVSIFGITPTPEAIFLDWFPYDLETYVIESQLTLKESTVLLSDISKGLAYIHRVGYIHLDIRPKNILVRNQRAVICDFGMSIIDQPPYNHNRAVDCWVAPEIVFGKEVSTKTDIYSLGLVIWFICESKGTDPFPKTTTESMIKAAFQGKERPRWNAPKSDELKKIYDITKKCWRDEMESRPTARMIVDIFNEMKDKTL
ncbi:hypothetical protein ENUP19_0126G0012 [Entamoeba nuttalli]|uniref:Protein kinase domain containing protein n=2 Tax=Entamoeba nuttalli TaxID=412467 RepID=K2HYD7_ENTNP|nr:protein kinase domain containing protein [Entamoeba nuttalli P19]EKE41400.1 protein kinase domain containing protein [Entamoeba nuttalli P19]|eukprot:XP_008856268.1 protein kinase domain containing protein [Entamoeba nuttalli P19]